MKQYTDTKAVNELDLPDALSKLKEGDASLEELNLNNHPDMTEDILVEVVDNLKNNTSLKKLHLANTQMKDHLALVSFYVFLLIMYILWRDYRKYCIRGNGLKLHLFVFFFIFKQQFILKSTVFLSKSCTFSVHNLLKSTQSVLKSQTIVCYTLQYMNEVPSFLLILFSV